MRRRVLALAQIAPVLGDLRRNFDIHGHQLAEARAAGADLVIFPELGLTGYQLQDLAPEVAMRRTDARLHALAKQTIGGPSAIVSFVEASDDHRLFAAAAVLEDGEVRHVARKSYLPTYGLFDERRFLAPGDAIRSTRAVLGGPQVTGEVGLGIGICEDFWHPSLPAILAQDGAELLVNVAAGPARGASLDVDQGLGSAASWGMLLRATASLTTSYVAFTNRVGVDESLIFWGGSRVIGPDGVVLCEAPLFEEALLLAEIDLDEVGRARTALPLLRDERLELTRREYGRLIAARAELPEDGAT
ncbi:MAG: carbon-nitrogen hydrolase [bacterium]|jgi:predicted amidohydrolase|nr:carbon-nitrogen hydrolase [Candidatus Aquidulcis sp.]